MTLYKKNAFWFLHLDNFLVIYNLQNKNQYCCSFFLHCNLKPFIGSDKTYFFTHTAVIVSVSCVSSWWMSGWPDRHCNYMCTCQDLINHILSTLLINSNISWSFLTGLAPISYDLIKPLHWVREIISCSLFWWQPLSYSLYGPDNYHW